MARVPEPYFHPRLKLWRLRCGGKDTYAPKEFGSRDKRKAWEWFAARVAEVKADLKKEMAGTVRTTVDDPTVHLLGELYLAWLKNEVRHRRHSRHSLVCHSTNLKVFCEYGGMKHLPISKLTPAIFQEFLNHSKGIHSANYTRNIARSVQRMLNWAAVPQPGRPIERLIPSNPIRGASLPRVPRVNRYYDRGDINQLLRLFWSESNKQFETRKANGRNAVWLLRFMLLSGSRLGEVCRLKWDHIDVRGGVAEFPADEHKTGGRTGETRVIYLTPRMARLLNLVQAVSSRPDGFVFGHNKGPWTPGSIGQKFRKWRDKLAKSDIVPYSARHAYCTEALLAGVSYADLGKMVGNSPGTLEKYYDHPVKERLKEVAAKFERERGRQ